MKKAVVLLALWGSMLWAGNCPRLGETIAITGQFDDRAFLKFVPGTFPYQPFCVQFFEGPALIPARPNMLLPPELPAEATLHRYVEVTGQVNVRKDGMYTLTILSTRDVDVEIHARIADWEQGCRQWIADYKANNPVGEYPREIVEPMGPRPRCGFASLVHEPGKGMHTVTGLRPQ